MAGLFAAANVVLASCTSAKAPVGDIGSSAVSLDGVALGDGAWLSTIEPDTDFADMETGWRLSIGDELPDSSCANADPTTAAVEIHLVWWGTDGSSTPAPIAIGSYPVSAVTPSTTQTVANIFVSSLSAPLTSGTVQITASSAAMLTGTIDADGSGHHFAGTFAASDCSN